MSFNPIRFLGSLPTFAQAGLAIVGVVGGLATTTAVMVAMDEGENKTEWNFKSEIDRSIIPEAIAEEIKKEEEEPFIVEEPEEKEEKPEPKKPVIRKETFKPKIKEPIKKEPPVKAAIKIVQKAANEEKSQNYIKPEPPKYIEPEIQNIKVVDEKAELIKKYNAMAYQMVGEDFGKIGIRMEQAPKLYQKIRQRQRKIKDRNKQDNWGIKVDSNTYPTDLSRVVIKEKFIKCITGNKIISTLKGRVTVHISENVYGAQGNKVLIPKGAKGTGFYEPVEKIGDGRINLYIERFVIDSDGQLILFSDPAVAGDQQGATGVTGDIDHQYMKKFGLPLVFSIANNMANFGITKIIEQAEKSALKEGGVEDVDENPTWSEQVFDEQWQRNQQDTNQQVINEILKNHIDLKEKITINAATEIIVYLNHDIWFKEDRNRGTKVVNAVRLKNNWKKKLRSYN